MNELNNLKDKNSKNNYAKTVKEISELQDMPEEVIKKLISAQGSLKNSEFATKIYESKKSS